MNKTVPLGLEKLGYAPVPDADFAKDVQAAIDAHREPLNPPAWA